MSLNLYEAKEITLLTTADKLRSLADSIEEKASKALYGDSTIVDSIYGKDVVLRIGYDQQQEKSSTNYEGDK